jgi:hypothetical protein
MQTYLPQKRALFEQYSHVLSSSPLKPWVAGIARRVRFGDPHCLLPLPISTGGLSLPPPTVGLIFGTLGLIDGLMQLVLFPPVFETIWAQKDYDWRR